jgi:hypothetical protein
MLKAASILCAVLLLGLGATGCESKPKPTGDSAASQSKKAAPAATQSATGATKAAAASSGEPYADVDDKDIPDEADFEEEAAKEITAENYAAKLDEIAKELGETGDDEEGKEAKEGEEAPDDEADDEAPDEVAPDDDEEP